MALVRTYVYGIMEYSWIWLYYLTRHDVCLCVDDDVVCLFFWFCCFSPLIVRLVSWNWTFKYMYINRLYMIASIEYLKKHLFECIDFSTLAFENGNLSIFLLLFDFVNLFCSRLWCLPIFVCSTICGFWTIRVY